jgi:hypothetical protein
MQRFYQNLLGKRADLKGPMAKAEASGRGVRVSVWVARRQARLPSRLFASLVSRRTKKPRAELVQGRRHGHGTHQIGIELPTFHNLLPNPAPSLAPLLATERRYILAVQIEARPNQPAAEAKVAFRSWRRAGCAGLPIPPLSRPCCAHFSGAKVRFCANSLTTFAHFCALAAA